MGNHSTCMNCYNKVHPYAKVCEYCHQPMYENAEGGSFEVILGIVVFIGILYWIFF